MLESMTIFTLGGCILYQYCAIPSLVKHHHNFDTDGTGSSNPSDDPAVASTASTTTGGASYTRHLINSVLIEQFLLPEYNNQNHHNSTSSNKSYHITDGMTMHWMKHTLSTPTTNTTTTTTAVTSNTIIFCVAIYPDILFEGPRQYLKVWAEHLVNTTIREYDTYYRHTYSNHSNRNSSSSSSSSSLLTLQQQQHRPDEKIFDTIFRIVLNNSKTQKQPQQPTQQQQMTSSDQEESLAATTTTTSSNVTSNKNEKVQRNWHDGKGTITVKAMAALDKSTTGTTNKNENATKEEIIQLKQEHYERALREAKMAYLPNEEEIKKSNIDNISSTANNDNAATISQSSWMVSIFQQVMGTKVLTQKDLEVPIRMMITKLQQKNVSLSVAQEIGNKIQQQLVGQTLNSFYTIQTAVQQSLETILMNILTQSQQQQQQKHKGGNMKNSIDLIQNVIQKRNNHKTIWSSITNTTSSGSTKRRPYVISVMGINGIGKTTTIAKLAYYFQQHQLTPLLVAGDTFRSGAIEQLRIHADCLNVPFFQQGYSKDPSSVTAAGIMYATEQQYDVVLIDTAGRMQNNIPLMKSLNKLMVENQPDYCIMVCEAIVGHDGINQFQMFQQALGNSRKVDGLILTKFDTVDSKVGACLTLTYECQTPIVFLGVGQKYHHLQPLHISTIMKGLFA